MLNQDHFKNKKITIVGFARSGLACANLLSELGAQVSITDNQDNALTRRNCAQLKSKDIKIELGRHTREFIKDRDIVVISPGVADSASAIVWAKESGIPVISEIEAASILCPATIIAITGTNGKTTVTTLIGKVLEARGEKVFVCGNIGKPFSGEVKDIKRSDFVSLEISSFQLEHIEKFKPKISVILNLSRNHLDRYSNMQEYLEAKKRIFMNQDKEDYLVLNFEDPLIKELGKETKANVAYFHKDKDLNPNESAVMAVSSILGIDKDLVLRVFKDFRGVEHRLEQVAEINGIRFINDSKATTVDATIWALLNSSNPVILIAGGREKGNDYSLMLDLAKSRVKRAVLIGESKEKIRHAFSGLFPIDEADNLEDAVNKAFSQAKSGDSILLSPMCKSFDMFRDYEERGMVFKSAVRALILDKQPNTNDLQVKWYVI